MNAKTKYKIVMEMWDTHTAQEIADKLNTSRQTIYSYVARMRAGGIKIPLKRGNTIEELKKELKIK